MSKMLVHFLNLGTHWTECKTWPFFPSRKKRAQILRLTKKVCYTMHVETAHYFYSKCFFLSQQ